MTKPVLSRGKNIHKDSDRVSCPYCKELIIFGAKKCRFCKENLSEVEKSTENKSNFFNRKIMPYGPYKLWLLSMVIFLISISQLQVKSDSDWWIAMLASVAVGVVSFIALLASIPNSKGKYGVFTLITLILFVGILANHDAVASAFGLKSSSTKSNVREENAVLEPTASPTPTPSLAPTKPPTKVNNANTVQSNKVECIGPDGKQFTTTMEECKNLNEKWGKPVNYILDCNIHPNCGGGVVRMSKTQCESPCSGLSNNKNSSNKTQESTSKASFYCYDNVTGFSYYTTSGEQCNKDNLVSLCENGHKIQYDYCMDTCLSDQNSRSSNCIYNYKDSHMDDCLDEAHVVYQQCMDDCATVRQADTKKCY